MRLILPPPATHLAIIATLWAGSLEAQAAVASDLWWIAQGTLVVPPAISDDGSAPLWTPAVTLAADRRILVGVEAIQAPSEIGVSGGVVALSWRVARVGLLSATYGRLSLGSVGFTETSPELTGSLQIYNQTASVGLSRAISSTVTAGMAIRHLSGQLATQSHSQLGIDLGARFQTTGLRAGISTRFLDPGFGSNGKAASLTAGAEYRTPPFDAWGAATTLAMRYGFTAAPDASLQHLLSAGFAFGSALSFDIGAAREKTASDTVWRSLLGVGIGTGRYVVRIGRDGGVNNFGATYRFGLTAVFK